MHDIFSILDTTHDFRDGQKLIMPKFNTVQYGKMTFTYYGAHLWNLLSFQKSHQFSNFQKANQRMGWSKLQLYIMRNIEENCLDRNK